MKLLLDIFSSLYNFTTWFESCSQLLNTKMKSVIAENLLSEGFLNEQFKEEQFTMEEIESSFSVEKSFYFYLNNCYLLFILFKVNNLDRPIFKKSTNKDELYVFFEKAYSSSEVKSEYKIFIYPNDFTEIMDYINYLFLKDGCLNYTKFLENEFQLTKNGKIDKEYWHNGVMLKPYKNSLDIYSSTFIYLRERIKESIDEILKMESLQRYLQNNNLEKEFDINKYLSNFPMKKEVEYLYSNVDFTKLENICNKEEIERMKIIYSYFWINFNEKELQKKKLHKELYKNLNYLFGKYLNLITIFQYQIIATMSRKDYKNYSVHKVHHKCCKTLFFIYEIYCLPIIKKLIIYRIENYLNKLMNDNDQLEEINMEMKTVAENLMLLNVPNFYFNK
ncbi:hypothetical protein ABK040_008978 [Willaertia magna]